MSKRRVSRRGAAKMLYDGLDLEVGVLTANGQRVYGHRRIQAQRIRVTTKMLRDQFAAPGAHPAPMELERGPVEQAEPLPNSPTSTLPCAEHAGRLGRAACIAVAVIGVLVVVGLEVDIAAAVAATRIGKLIAGAFARIA